MAHELYVNEQGVASMAFTGSRSEIWHGLGQEIDTNQPIEKWIEAAGFNWDVKSAAVKFLPSGEKTHAKYEGRKILYRSDTKTELSIVSDEYKVVQPKEVMEFFRDLVGNAGMKLSTAGVLFGGRKFWALADTGNFGVVNGKDEIKGNLLLTTSCDGSSSTIASLVSTRVVCNNTLEVALREGQSRFSTRHSKDFNPMLVKENLGLLNDSWAEFMKTIDAMSKKSIDDKFAEEFIFNLIKDTRLADDEQSGSTKKATMEMFNRFKRGIGNEGKTTWDLLNGITEYYDHYIARNRNKENKLWSNFYGWDASKKIQAYEELAATL